VLLVAKDVFQFAEIFHYNATTCQDKRKNQQFEVPYCHKRNDHLPAASNFEKQVYLGMLLHYNGKFLQTEKRLSQQGARALSSLMNSFKSVYISTEQQCISYFEKQLLWFCQC
jgi:hypothetical protein